MWQTFAIVRQWAFCIFNEWAALSIINGELRADGKTNNGLVQSFGGYFSLPKQACFLWEDDMLEELMAHFCRRIILKKSLPLAFPLSLSTLSFIPPLSSGNTWRFFLAFDFIHLSDCFMPLVIYVRDFSKPPNVFPFGKPPPETSTECNRRILL